MPAVPVVDGVHRTCSRDQQEHGNALLQAHLPHAAQAFPHELVPTAERGQYVA